MILFLFFRPEISSWLPFGFHCEAVKVLAPQKTMTGLSLGRNQSLGTDKVTEELCKIELWSLLLCQFVYVMM